MINFTARVLAAFLIALSAGFLLGSVRGENAGTGTTIFPLDSVDQLEVHTAKLTRWK